MVRFSDFSKSVVIMMIGFRYEKFHAFTQASKYLDSLFSAKAQRILREGVRVPLSHRPLVLGKPNPDDLNGLRYPRS